MLLPARSRPCERATGFAGDTRSTIRPVRGPHGGPRGKRYARVAAALQSRCGVPGREADPPGTLGVGPGHPTEAKAPRRGPESAPKTPPAPRDDAADARLTVIHSVARAKGDTLPRPC